MYCRFFHSFRLCVGRVACATLFGGMERVENSIFMVVFSSSFVFWAVPDCRKPLRVASFHSFIRNAKRGALPKLRYGML